MKVQFLDMNMCQCATDGNVLVASFQVNHNRNIYNAECNILGVAKGVLRIKVKRVALPMRRNLKTLSKREIRVKVQSYFDKLISKNS